MHVRDSLVIFASFEDHLCAYSQVLRRYFCSLVNSGGNSINVVRSLGRHMADRECHAQKKECKFAEHGNDWVAGYECRVTTRSDPKFMRDSIVFNFGDDKQERTGSLILDPKRAKIQHFAILCA